MNTGAINKSQVAETTPFDNDNTDFVSDNVQDVIVELSNTVSTSASPGFSFGRSSNVGANTWLQITGSVPSNRTGIPVAIQNASLALVSVGNENISTFDITIYEHEGDQINLTTLTTVSVVSARTGNFLVDVPVTTGRQLAARVTSGSARNIGVSLQLKGES